MKKMPGLGGMSDCAEPVEKQVVKKKKKEGVKSLGKSLLKYK